MYGSDAKHSLEADEFKEMEKQAHEIEESSPGTEIERADDAET